MNAAKKALAVVATAGLLMASSMASAVPFTVTSASFTPAGGYGIDSIAAEILFGGSKLELRLKVNYAAILGAMSEPISLVVPFAHWEWL